MRRGLQREVHRLLAWDAGTLNLADGREPMVASAAVRNGA